MAKKLTLKRRGGLASIPRRCSACTATRILRLPLLLVAVMLSLISNTAWADEYTYTFTSKQFSSDGEVTLNDVAWTLSTQWPSDSTYYGYSNLNYYGQQIGSKKVPASSATLSTSALDGTITSVTVNAAAYSTSATIEVAVGDNSFTVGATSSTSSTLSKTNTDHTFNGSASGNVVITLSNPSSGGGGLYIKTITVTYSTGSTFAFSASTATATLGESFTAPTLTNTYGGTVSYTSSNTGVATVASDGTVSLVSAGTTTITATTDADASVSASYVLTVSESSSTVGDVWTLVTSDDELDADGEYIIVCNSQSAVMGALNASSSSYATSLTASAITSSTTEINDSDLPSGYEVITLEGSDAAWYIKNTSQGYITSGIGYSASTPSSTATISIASDGTATIYWGTATTTTLQYNSSSPRFKTYKSPQTAIQLYKKAAPVKTPEFSPEAGTYYNAQNVTITCATEGATIIYTTDGTTPSATNGTNYTGPVTVSGITTIKAVAIAEIDGSEESSSVATAEYVIAVADPVFSPEAGTYYEAQSVTITCATEGATIIYTTDGTTPSATNGTNYTGPVTVSETTTIKAVAIAEIDGSEESSSVATATYTIKKCLTIAEFNALDYDTTAMMGSVTVIAHYKTRLWVKDETGYMLIFNEEDNITEYEQGDVIPAGFTGTKKLYHGEPELKVTSSSGFTAATETATVIPEVITLASGAVNHHNFGHYVTVKNVTFTTAISEGTGNLAGTLTDDDGTTYVFYFNNMGVDPPTDTSIAYDVNGVICSYQWTSDSVTNTIYEIILLGYTPTVAATETTLDYLASEGVEQTYYKVTGTNLKSVGHFTAYNEDMYLVICDDVQSVHNYVDTSSDDVQNAADMLKDDQNIDQKAFTQVNWMLVRVQNETDYNKVNKTLTSVTGTLTDDFNLNFDATEVVADEDATTELNTYTPLNFMGNTLVSPDDTTYFFMTPKRSEMVKAIWLVYGGNSCFYLPSDYKYNPHKLAGGVQAIWTYNVNGDISADLTVGETYEVTAIVKEIAATSTDAPRKVAATPYTDGGISSTFEIWPLDVNAETIVTGVTGATAAKQVQSVRYYDLTGRTSLKPFEGVNVVVTTYTDGTRATAKVLK